MSPDDLSEIEDSDSDKHRFLIVIDINDKPVWFSLHHCQSGTFELLVLSTDMALVILFPLIASEYVRKNPPDEALEKYAARAGEEKRKSGLDEPRQVFRRVVFTYLSFSGSK